MTNFEKFLFQLTIFLIPTNLAYHFISNDAFVNGILVDYLIPKLYLSDLPILLLLLLWLIKSYTVKNVADKSRDIFSSFKTQSSENKKKSVADLAAQIIFPYLLFLSLFITALASPHPLAGMWYFLKLLELSLFFLWIKFHLTQKLANKRIENNFLQIALTWLKAKYELSFKIKPQRSSSAIDENSVLKAIVPPLLWAMLFQSLLGLYQFLSQHSLAGYWFLGETTLTYTANIAKTSVWPFEGLRILPYGTTPHPNVLAGFLAIGLVLVVSHWKQIKFSNVLKLLVLSFDMLVLYLTQSLSALLALAVGISIVFIPSKYRTSLIFSGVLICLGVLSLNTQYLPFRSLGEGWRNTDSIVRRGQLNHYAWQMFLDNPLTGIGLNQFTAVLPSYGVITAYTSFLQPVHNIYLLWLSETGLVGILLLFLLFRFISKQTPQYPLLSTVPIIMFMIIGTFDHYPLTIQTGQLLSVLALALSIDPVRKLS